MQVAQVVEVGVGWGWGVGGGGWGGVGVGQWGWGWGFSRPTPGQAPKPPKGAYFNELDRLVLVVFSFRASWTGSKEGLMSMN